MKNVYVRDNNSILKISLKYFYALIPLVVYGIYKNGIHLHQKDLVSFVGIFKPIVLIIIGAFIGVIVNYLYERIVMKSNDKLINILFSSFHILYGILIACMVSINTNIFLFAIITFLVLFISKLFKLKSLNIVALVSLVIILIMYLFSNFSYLNVYESSTVLNLNATDYLIGRGSGGIATTFISGLVISLIILFTEKTYKKEIAIYSIISFSILILLYCVWKDDISKVFELLFTNGILFSLIFVAPETVSSSYTNVGKIIYGIVTAVLTFILYLVNPSLAVLGAILISSILSSVIDVNFE